MAWTELADRHDMLRLLALVARGTGVKGGGLEEYQPPSAELREMWTTRPEPPDPDVRRMSVQQFLAETGGA